MLNFECLILDHKILVYSFLHSKIKHSKSKIQHYLAYNASHLHS